MTRATGIVRRVDELGRIVIPKELRRVFGIDEGDALEIFTTDNNIILKKYQPGCQGCGSMEGLITHAGITVCPSCLQDMVKQAKLDQITNKR